MNKRILSILLCLMLVTSLLVLAVPAGAVSDMKLSVTADKNEVKPGDTVTYSVILEGPVKDFGYIGIEMVPPTGLSFVPGSAQVPDGLLAEMGWSMLDFGEEFVLSGTAKKTNYNCDDDLLLGTFQCTVDNDATGTLTMGYNEDDFSIGDYLDIDAEPNVSISMASVTVSSGAPATEAPATEAPATEAPATEAPATEAPATEAPVTEAPATEAPHVHALQYVPQVDPTYDNFGVAKHYVCTECGKKFADSTGAVEVTDADLVIPKLIPPTEAPFTEAPATEAPATEAPATEAPATEAPLPTEAPDATKAPDAPVVDDPTEAPEATEVAPATGDEATKDQASKDQATRDAATKDSKTTSSPKTGDSTHMYLWMLIMLTSLAGVCAVLYTAKRKGIFTK